MTQADLAKSIGVSEMQISRLMRALYREASPPTDLDALKCLAVPEIMKAGFSSGLAVQILVEFASEVRYLSDDQERKCWVAFCLRDQDGTEVQLSALRARHLESIIDSFPVSLILPLHGAIAAARAKLDRLKAEKSRRAAA